MIRYEVTVTVREELVPAFEAYFLEKHIPEIFATGCFVRIRFDRSESGIYRTVYHAATRADLDRYLAEHAAGLRADFAKHFPEGATPSRENWTEIRSWTR